VKAGVLLLVCACLKKNAPHIKWVISFADGTQCGDGAIYRASGFKLLRIQKNTTLRVNPANGEALHRIGAYHLKLTTEFDKWPPFEGYQFKYIYFLDKSVEKDLTLPVLPFSKIDELGAGMYKGKKITVKERGVNAAMV